MAGACESVRLRVTCRWTAEGNPLQTDVVPTTKYAKSGEVNIAYQAFGDGALDLVFVPGFISHIELAWEEPYLARFLRRLAVFSRVIFFDKRGTGLSDPVSRPPGLVERMDDIRAVMDAAGSSRRPVRCLRRWLFVHRVRSCPPDRSAPWLPTGLSPPAARADYPWGWSAEHLTDVLMGWIRAGPAGSGGPRPIPALPVTSVTRRGGPVTCGPPPAPRWGAGRLG